MAATPGRIIERGRSKAYRPLPADARRDALARGLAAYERGAFYLAHEELEPAWMGSADPSERALLGGLIKLAAAFVHAERGNPLGVQTNLQGSLDRLADAVRSGGPDAGLDLPALVDAVCARLSAVRSILAAAGPVPQPRPADDPVPSHDVAGPAGRVRGARVGIEPLVLPRRGEPPAQR